MKYLKGAETYFSLSAHAYAVVTELLLQHGKAEQASACVQQEIESLKARGHPHAAPPACRFVIQKCAGAGISLSVVSHAAMLLHGLPDEWINDHTVIRRI